MQERNIQGNKVINHDDGSFSIEMPDGTKALMTKDGKCSVTRPDGSTINTSEGGVNIDLKSIRSLGVENIFDLSKYFMRTHEGLTTHEMEFRDGGRFSVAYDDDGTIQKLEGSKVGMSLTRENRVLIKMHNSRSNKAD